MKTNQLIGPALDWAVQWAHNPTGPTGAGWYERDANNKLFDPLNEYTISPSTDWAQGGPIKTRERISTQIKHDGWWVACIYNMNDDPTYIQLAHSELVAAMRCYVASKLGDEVDIPKELT